MGAGSPDARTDARAPTATTAAASEFDKRGASHSEQLGQLCCGVAAEVQFKRLAWFGFSFGCLPRRSPFALATCMPSRVRILIRSDSNSATIANTLNNKLPTGSVGS